MGERDRDMSSLNNKLLSLQVDIKNLHDVCKRQGKTLQENQLCVEEAMMNSGHVRDQQLLPTSAPSTSTSTPQAGIIIESSSIDHSRAFVDQGTREN